MTFERDFRQGAVSEHDRHETLLLPYPRRESYQVSEYFLVV